jgi:hypothetical protein
VRKLARDGVHNGFWQNARSKSVPLRGQTVEVRRANPGITVATQRIENVADRYKSTEYWVISPCFSVPSLKMCLSFHLLQHSCRHGLALFVSKVLPVGGYNDAV